MFLTESAVQELTGYLRHADQRRWLAKRGWKHEVSATGRPIVSAAYAESQLSDSQKKQEWTPNLSAFKKKAA
jgi:hypothetical protein